MGEGRETYAPHLSCRNKNTGAVPETHIRKVPRLPAGNPRQEGFRVSKPRAERLTGALSVPTERKGLKADEKECSMFFAVLYIAVPLKGWP